MPKPKAVQKAVGLFCDEYDPLFSLSSLMGLLDEVEATWQDVESQQSYDEAKAVIDAIRFRLAPEGLEVARESVRALEDAYHEKRYNAQIV